MRRAVLFATLLATLLIAGCGNAERATPRLTTSSSASARATAAVTNADPSSTLGTTTRADSSPSSSSTTADATSSGTADLAAVARRFGTAYARYLDGRLAADQVPLVTSTARGQLGPVIPTSARRGSLRIAGIHELGTGPTFVIELRDHAHTFSVQVSLGVVGSREVVSTVVPPDIDSVLHSTSRAPHTPRGSAAPEAAARRFMSGYLPWLYGHGKLAAIRDARRSLIAYLRSHAPQIPPTSRGLHGHVAAIGMTRSRKRWTALANVSDGQETYELKVVLVRVRGRWLASNVQPVA